MRPFTPLASLVLLSLQLAGSPLAARVQAIVDSVRQLELRDDLTLLAVSDETRVR